MPRLAPCSAQPPEPGARPGPGFSVKVSPGVGSSWPVPVLSFVSSLSPRCTTLQAGQAFGRGLSAQQLWAV